MPQPLVTLTTDFGLGSPYVAEMKGVLFSLNPALTLIDVTHGIKPQNIREGALVVAQFACRFPPGTIHLVVVDPGVGTKRKLIYAQLGDQQFVCPDNGLLSRLALATPATTIIELSAPEHWLPQVSKTFHGRDIMAPVAARLSLGLEPQRLGTPLDHIVTLDWPEVCVSGRKITGSVQSIDSFGNLITDITSDKLADVPRGEQTGIFCDEHETRGIFGTYGDQPEMTLIALVGSSGNLELAIVGDSAALMLGVRVGTPVRVEW